MKAELRAKIIAYNKKIKAREEKTTDLEEIMAAFGKFPLFAQLVKLLPAEIKEKLEKYGII